MSRIFTATLDAVSSNKTKTVIKLSLTNKEAAVFAQRYLASIDKELHVSFEDPQLEMQFQREPNGRPGLVVTTNERGEVESAVRDDDEDDAQGDLFPQDGDTGDTGDPDPDDDDLDFPEEGDDPIADNLGEDTEADPEDVGADPEIDREQLEEYILEKQPTFDDIPFNFPMLLRRRREENITWKDLAMEASTSTIRLQNFYTDYKQRVASKMKADGVA